MQPFANAFSVLAVLAVAAVLGAGLFNMLRNGSANTSQLLMRWRVGLQFVAICVLMLLLFFKRS